MPLELDNAEMKRLSDQTIQELIEFIEHLPDGPACGSPLDMRTLESFRTPPSDSPGNYLDLLGLIMKGAKGSLETAGPGFLAFIPSGGVFAAALADFIACTVNRFTPVSMAAPPFAELERSLLEWLAGELGMPSTALGMFTSGGTTANITALVVARHAKAAGRECTPVIVTSEFAHVSIDRAALVNGIPPKNVQRIRAENDLSLGAKAVDEHLSRAAHDRDRPLVIVATAGVTDNGCIDDLVGLREVADKWNAWLHVDAAYGGFFKLADSGSALLDGLGEADSLTVDPHKGLFLPYGTGCLFVRDGRHLVAAFKSPTAPYASDLSSQASAVDSIEIGTELTRDFRALRVWLPLHLHGVTAFRSALEEKLQLARLMYDRLKAIDQLELPWEPKLSVVLFRIADDSDAPTKALLEEIIATNRFFVASTTIRGRYFVRVCVLSHRTHVDRIEELLNKIKSIVKG